MMTFDRVLPELIRICEEDADSRDGIAKYCVVRDVRGRVRLVVEPKRDAASSLEGLKNMLANQLGDYFVEPILSTAESNDVQRLAVKLLERAGAHWPTGWPRSYRNVLGTGSTPIACDQRWVGIERTIGKEAWLANAQPKPPWPLLRGKTPPVVTYHSFKGGVGRTTLVAAHAIQLANGSPPRRVAVVDLDVEAPGLGSLFGAGTERGVLDILVDHIATGNIDLDGAFTHSALGHAVDDSITVFPAGRVDDSYVQKLARLDFSSTEPGMENPVGAALGQMLKVMKEKFQVILLDSRAGLHDLAGMSLHGLAHVDVLVFRGTDQHLVGLGQTLRTLGDREDTRLVLIETLLPAADEELFETRRQRSRQKVYDLLLEYVYPDENPPQLKDSGEPHDVLTIRRKEWLDALDSFAGHVEQVVGDEELGLIAKRIDDECALEAQSSTPDNEDDE